MYTKNKYNSVLSTLEGINQNKCRSVMVDYDSFIHRVHHEMYIQTFINLFRENEKTNNKSLSDEDLRDYINGNVADISKDFSATP